VSSTFYADRSDRGKLRFSGPQDRWFLHQILTQAFEDIAPGEARDAAMITAHGRMVGYLEVLATEGGLLAHFEPELIGSLPEAIRRYVFATQVEIEDVTDTYHLILVGEGGAFIDELSALPGVHIHPTSALGVPAFYVWTPSSEQVVSILVAGGAEEASEERLEAVRIENGVARWGRDMDAKTFPQEAGIDGRAVHFDKGCYVGQEAMAKIHFRGKVNRRLARIASERPVETGMELTLDGQRVGVITSSVGLRALAMLRYSVEPGATLTADDREVAVVG
jgi:tRNA-modifying protein YgfZ